MERSTPMKNKKSICILGQDVKIEHSKDNLVGTNGNYLYGFYNDHEKKITIAPIDHKVELEKTILHEIGHAMIFRSGLAQVLSHEVQEILCEVFSNVVHENFKIKADRRK